MEQHPVHVQGADKEMSAGGALGVFITFILRNTVERSITYE